MKGDALRELLRVHSELRELCETLIAEKAELRARLDHLGGLAREQLHEIDELNVRVNGAERRERELRVLLDDAHAQLLERDQQLQAGLDLLRRGLPEPPSRTRSELARHGLDPAYEALVEEIHTRLRMYVPTGSTVLVVSKGDDRLTSIPGYQGWHYPRAESGEYAGYYPPDSEAAIEHLEELREAGAHYLLFPQTALWWLDHYPELRAHVEQVYRTLLHDETCVVYALHDPETEERRAASEGYRSLVGRFRAFVEHHVPAGSAVAVVSRGDDRLLDIPGRETSHFPCTADGVYAGHHPADDAEAIARVVEARTRVGYLAFPNTALWWLGHYGGLARELDRRWALVARDEEIGVVYAAREYGSLLRRIFRRSR